MPLSINVADGKFDRSDCDKDKTRILLVFFMSKKSTKADYLIFNIKKDNQVANKSGEDAKGSWYLTPDARKAFNLLLHIFIQASIF